MHEYFFFSNSIRWKVSIRSTQVMHNLNNHQMAGICAAVKRAVKSASCLGSSAICSTDGEYQEIKVWSLINISYLDPYLDYCHSVGETDSSSGN